MKYIFAGCFISTDIYVAILFCIWLFLSSQRNWVKIGFRHWGKEYCPSMILYLDDKSLSQKFGNEPIIEIMNGKTEIYWFSLRLSIVATKVLYTSWSLSCNASKNVIEASCNVSEHIMNSLRLWNKFELFFMWNNFMRAWDESLTGLSVIFLEAV